MMALLQFGVHFNRFLSLSLDTITDVCPNLNDLTHAPMINRVELLFERESFVS